MSDCTVALPSRGRGGTERGTTVSTRSKRGSLRVPRFFSASQLQVTEVARGGLPLASGASVSTKS